MSPFAVFLFSLFILLHRAAPHTDKPERLELEMEALLRFFNAFNLDKSYKWTKSEHTCSWKGVYCDPTNTTVIQLSLPAAKLNGEIPLHTIGSLSNLLVLSLHNNSLNGSIPSDFCNLALSELYLENNKFSSHLWNIIADDLEILNVSNNAFTCRIPPSLYRFPFTSFFGNTHLYRSRFPISLYFGETNLYDFPKTNRTLYYYPKTNRTHVVHVFIGCCNNRSGIPFLCSDFSPCSSTNESSKKKRETVAISAGLGLLSLMLLCCIGKRIYKSRKQSPTRPSEDSGADSRALKSEGGLVLFDDGISDLDCDELLLVPGEVLGRGSAGTTYKRVLEEKKTTVVLKRLKDVVVTKTEFESHMEVLGKMKNENVVPLRGYCYSEDEKWLVYDYMHGGSLFDHLHGSIGLSERGLKWDNRKKVALSAGRGVAFLHSNNVVHGNIKSSNILLQQETNQHFVAKVSDYGLNTLFEVVKTRDLSMKSDVYSFGVLLVELLTGKAPNQSSLGWNENGFAIWVQSLVQDESKVEIFDVELRDQNIKEMFQMLQIAKDCVSIVLDQRPTMHNVVSMMEDMNPVEIDDWLRQSSDPEPSKGYDDTPSTMFTQDTPSTVEPST